MVAPTFMTLPCEIRLQIYDHALSSLSRLIPSHQEPGLENPVLTEDFSTAILQVNKKIYQEALSSFYSLNHFHLRCSLIYLSSESSLTNDTTTSPPRKPSNTTLNPAHAPLHPSPTPFSTLAQSSNCPQYLLAQYSFRNMSHSECPIPYGRSPYLYHQPSRRSTDPSSPRASPSTKQHLLHDRRM